MSAYRAPGEVPSKCEGCGCHVAVAKEPWEMRGWHRVVVLAAAAVILGEANGLTLASLGHLACGVFAAAVAIIIIVDWCVRGNW